MRKLRMHYEIIFWVRVRVVVMVGVRVRVIGVRVIQLT